MSYSAFREALQPLVSRMPRVVREHEILRVAATVQGKDTITAAETARSEILRWAERRCGGRLPENAWDYGEFEYFSGGRNSVAVRILSDTSDIWAIRADDPDKNIPGRVWTTEAVVGVMGPEQPKFSLRLLVSTSEDDLHIEPHAPGFVQQITETCGLSIGSLTISSEPWVVNSEDETNKLVDLLIDPDRRLPFFVLSVSNGVADPRSPLLDASILARAILGIGVIVVLPSAFTWALTDRVGKIRSVFGGAVRAYLPGFLEDANPYGHRLILADQLSTDDGLERCSRWIRSLAASESIRRSRLGDDILAFSEIRNASLKYRQQQLEDEGANDSEQLTAAKERIKILEKQADEDKATQDYFATEHAIAEERAQAAEIQANTNSLRIQQLLEQLKQRGDDPDSNIELPSSWAELGDWVDNHLAGRVVLSPPARRGIRSPEFEDVQLTARCLLWLANECRDRRIKGGEGSVREAMVEDGIRNAHCGNDQYDLDWQGQKYTADWHLKNGGNTRDPKRCLRIYYFWDFETQQIVIADMPAHRRTGAS